MATILGYVFVLGDIAQGILVGKGDVLLQNDIHRDVIQ